MSETDAPAAAPRRPRRLTLDRLRNLMPTERLALDEAASKYCPKTLDEHPGILYNSGMKCKLVAYRRVSTKKQGDSGLGLEAQEAAVARHAAAYGCDVIGSYTEVESGKKNDRVELARAIAHAKRAKATLVIAKLDRLARNVAFIANLMETGVDFIACDNPHANRLTVHILAAVAEAEARTTSERTKVALAAAKAKGVVLGATGPKNLTREGTLRGSAAGVEAIRRNKAAAYTDILPVVRQLSSEGLSLRAIAARLNAEGHRTRRDRQWGASQIANLLAM